MHSQTVQEILFSIKKVHHTLIERAEDADHLSKNDRFHVMMDYVKRSEKDIEKIIHNIDRDVKGNTLNAWVRHYSDDPLVSINKVFKNAEYDNIEGFVDLLLESKNKLLDIYDSCINGSSNSEAQAIFQRLRGYEQSQLENFSRKVNGLSEDC